MSEKEKVNYLVATGRNDHELMTEVNYHINIGFVPFGSMTVLKTERNERIVFMFYQSMIRHDQLQEWGLCE